MTDPSAPAVAPVAPRVSQRTLLLLLAVVAVLLVLAIALLLRLLQPDALVVRGGEESAGLRPLIAIAGPGRGELPEFDRPMGGALDGEGRIWAADTANNRIVVFSSDGRYLFEIGGHGIAKPLPGVEPTWEEGLLNYPIGIDIDEEGIVYVADFRNDQVQVFDDSGAFVRRFPDPLEVVGRGGSGQDGTGIAVTDVAVADGLVFAADTYQVVVFTAEGEFVRQFGRPGTGPGEFDHLTGIDVTSDGLVLVADSNNGRVQALTADGEFVWSVGRSRSDGVVQPDVVSDFGLPRDVATLDDGSIAVLDSFGFSIVLLSPELEVIGEFGTRGANPGQLNFPNSIGTLGDTVIVSDKENGRVQVLEFVR